MKEHLSVHSQDGVQSQLKLPGVEAKNEVCSHQSSCGSWDNITIKKTVRQPLKAMSVTDKATRQSSRDNDAGDQ